jgi:hypothetical protein
MLGQRSREGRRWKTRPPSSDAPSSQRVELSFGCPVGGRRGFEIAQQSGDYRFVRVDGTSPYVVTVARRPRRSGRIPYWHNRQSALRLENRER